MASSITLSDSRTLSYSLDASPSGAPIVLLSNSLCAPFTSWDHVVPVLNKLGFRTLRYDQPGHGSSSSPQPLDSTSFSLMADDVAALLKALGISSLHGWIGVSMGAAAGLYFVAKNPGVVNKLVVCDTISCSPVNAGIQDPFGARIAAARKEARIDGTVQSTLERWFGTAWLDVNSDEAARMRSLMLRTSLDGFEACCHALRSESFDLRPLFGKVGASVNDALCVVGEKDANLPQTMEDMRAKVEEGFSTAGRARKVELKVIKNAGHVCFIDGFGQFIDVISSFLKA